MHHVPRICVGRLALVGLVVGRGAVRPVGPVLVVLAVFLAVFHGWRQGPRQAEGRQRRPRRICRQRQRRLVLVVARPRRGRHRRHRPERGHPAAARECPEGRRGRRQSRRKPRRRRRRWRRHPQLGRLDVGGGASRHDGTLERRAFSHLRPHGHGRCGGGRQTKEGKVARGSGGADDGHEHGLWHGAVLVQPGPGGEPQTIRGVSRRPAVAPAGEVEIFHRELFCRRRRRRRRRRCTSSGRGPRQLQVVRFRGLAEQQQRRAGSDCAQLGPGGAVQWGPCWAVTVTVNTGQGQGHGQGHECARTLCKRHTERQYRSPRCHHHHQRQRHHHRHRQRRRIGIGIRIRL